MYSWKDKVTERFSRLLSDSPSFPSSKPPDPQARLYSNEGNSLTSFLSHIVPSVSFDGYRSNKYQDDFRPIQSLPIRWRSKNLEWRDESSVSYSDYEGAYENRETPNSCDEVKERHVSKWSTGYNKETRGEHAEDKNHNCGRGNDSSSVLCRHFLEKRVPNLTDDSSFICSDLYEFLESSLPNIVKGCQWILLYSTLKHGISLRTLIRKSAEHSGPCLLIVGDMQGAVFGGLLECPLKPTTKRKYQGTNQTFVFTTIYGEPRLFRPTGANRYFYLCLNDILVLGGGGGNSALCLNEDLLSGKSGPCETFGNLCLAHSPEFELKNVEVWGFTHSSAYLS